MSRVGRAREAADEHCRATEQPDRSPWGISGARTPLPRVDPIPIAAASTVAGSRGADRGRASVMRGLPVRVMHLVPSRGGVLLSVITGPVGHPWEHRTPLSAEYDLWSSPW